MVVGLTDAGKSSIFRALQWVIYNKPSGSSMIPLFNKKEDWTEVAITFDDGTKVAKRKKGSVTEYIVGDKRLTGFGRGDVPKDVLDACRMDDINFQSQISLPFLMFETAGERSRVLNRVAGLDDIDSSLSRADSDSRRIRQALDSERELLSSLQASLDRFKDLEDRDKTVREAESMEKDLLTTQRIRDTVSSLLGRFVEIDEEVKKYSWVLKAETKINEAKDLEKKLTKVETHVQSLWLSLNDLNEIEEKIVNTSWIEKTAVQNMIDQASSLCKEIKRVELRTMNLLQTHAALDQIDRYSRLIQSEIDSITKSLPKTCPECGKPL